MGRGKVQIAIHAHGEEAVYAKLLSSTDKQAIMLQYRRCYWIHAVNYVMTLYMCCCLYCRYSLFYLLMSTVLVSVMLSC